MRAGNFSRASGQLIDPRTGLPIAGNQIPQEALSPTSLALLRYIPSPNLPGATQNFHYTTTTDSIGDNFSGRITHNFTSAAGRARRRRARRFRRTRRTGRDEAGAASRARS